jgi:hypothetical protein
MFRDLLPQFDREWLAAEHQVAQWETVRSTRDEALQQGWRAVQEVHPLASHVIPEPRGGRPNFIADDDDGSAVSKGQGHLLYRRIKGGRTQKSHSETGTRLKVGSQRENLVGKADVIDDDALRGSSGSRCVDDIGGVLGGEAACGRGGGEPRDGRRIGIEVDDVRVVSG